ncbi:MAG: tetratricopeptide repeat protein [Myxococcota bacterium]
MRKPPRLALGILLCLLVAMPLAVPAHPSLSEEEAFVERALAANPDDFTLHLRRARLHRERGRWDAAAASLLRAAELGADEIRVQVALARIFLDAGFPLTAERQIERVLASRPEHPEARIVRARISSALGKRLRAADDYRAGLLHLERPEPGLVLEAMEAQRAADRPEDALRVADAAMARIGVVASLQLPALEIELELGHPERALARIEVLLEQAPAHPLWLARRAELLEATGRAREARATYAQTLALLERRPIRRKSQAMRDLERRLRIRLAGLPTPEGSPP